MKVQEKLTYTNERGESIVFSPASSYHVNFKDVSGLSDVQNAIYSTNSMGQDGDTYLSENAQRGGNYYSGNARADIPFAEKRERAKQEQRGDDP